MEWKWLVVGILDYPSATHCAEWIIGLFQVHCWSIDQIEQSVASWSLEEQYY